jgi:hypothetical protein
MRKLLIGAAVSATAMLGMSSAAWATPNPNPNGPAHTGTACVSVTSNNPNANPAGGGHISSIGGANLFNVGAAFCGL